MKLKFPRNSNGDKGQALIEFAFMMPVVIGLIFGLIFVSILFYSYMTLQSAARDGAHAIITDGKNQTPTTIQALIQSRSFALGTVNVVISPPDQTLWTIPRILITVDAWYTIQFTQFTIPLPGNSPIRFGPITVHAQSNMWTD